MAEIRKVIIIGAGPAGLAAALHLKQKNSILPTVYEVRPEPTTLGGAVMVTCNGLRLLDRLGVLDEIRRRAALTPCAATYSSSGEKMGQFEIGTWSAKKTGYGIMRIKRTDLQDALLSAIQKEGIPVHFAKQTTAITETNDGVMVSFADGTNDSADLLLGCDGIHSAVRKLYVDPQVEPEYSGISTIYSFVPVSSLSPSSPAVTSLAGTFTRDGVFAVMPCSASGDVLFWFFQQGSRREEAGFKATLLGYLADMHSPWGALLRDVIRQTDVVKFYPIYRMPLGKTWSRGRCLLVGDAAHAMPPHTGQGIAMALEDVFLLSRLLLPAAAGDSDPLSAIFERFDRTRRPRVEKFFKTSVKRADLRKRTGPWEQWLKELFISAMLWLVTSLGLNKMGFGEGALLYDIDEAPI